MGSGEPVEVGPEHVAHGHEVLEGQRFCSPCARRHPDARHLVEALERTEADFADRCGLVGAVGDDLRAAEHELMRA